MQFSGKSVLLLGSGGLRIGQAGEFDYSGSQAIKALKQENLRVILINPNIATVQTDAHMADVVYLQPLLPEVVRAIISKERPNAILLGFGGQTALNLGLSLDALDILNKYQVQVLGTPVASIRKTEDRDEFKRELEKIKIATPKSFCVIDIDAAQKAAEKIGYPVMLRAGFSLGGLGSGKISCPTELIQRCTECFASVDQILIEEYLLGWKEFEYEIVRDAAGNALTICNMENLDPMGVHTGESIVIAPAQTLTNSEHQNLRNICLQIVDHFNIVGECNIQFAVHPLTREYRVIEMNARLSRSSALASKATGYPLAFVATKLGLGYLLHEIQNTVTQKTCAFFEPALDYVVIKIPRWDTQKLKMADRRIGTEMKSVGEVMAIGRSFPESLQKAVGMLNVGASCLSDYQYPITDIQDEIAHPTDRRLFALYRYFLSGASIQEAHELSKIDTWFLQHISAIAQLERKLAQAEISFELMQAAKQDGFSDLALAKLLNSTEEKVRNLRISYGIIPYVKQIDTLAGEFTAETNYLYLTYHGSEHDITNSNLNSATTIVVLGSGPYAIGSSVEFDWCAVNTVRTLRACNYNAILINSNPETVSTDYDESDRLYFEQLTLERVRDILDFEGKPKIIVSVGGQIANNLALPLVKAGYDLLGTCATAIDRAEDREKFSRMLTQLHIDQPQWSRVTSFASAKKFATSCGYPVLIRPSYILSGAAMNVAYDEAMLYDYLAQAVQISAEHPIVITKFILDAKELEIDGVAAAGKVVIDAIAEHIENAGVHSGDACLVMPPQRLYLETIRRTKKITREIVAALGITGPFNIQFIAKNNCLQVIELNLRASRSFPFISKVTGHNLIEIATKVMLGNIPRHDYETLELDYVGVKVPQFSYHRLKGANPVANVEMASTGEVACLGENLSHAYLMAWLATEQNLPQKRILFSLADSHKIKLLNYIQELDQKGWEFYATSGTHEFLTKHGVGSYFVYKASEGAKPSVDSLIAERKIELIINLPTAHGLYTNTDGFLIRRMAVDHNIPLITNLQIAQIMLQCLLDCKNNGWKNILSWQDYMQRRV